MTPEEFVRQIAAHPTAKYFNSASTAGWFAVGYKKERLTIRLSQDIGGTRWNDVDGQKSFATFGQALDSALAILEP